VRCFNPFARAGFILLIALSGALLRHGYPPSDGWPRFAVSILVFAAVLSPLLFDWSDGGSVRRYWRCRFARR
jgi:hypothetical protein